MSIEDHIRQSGQPPQERASSAKRVRLHRERQAQGVIIAPVPVDATIYSALAKQGLVPEYDATPGMIGKALANFVRRLIPEST